ncbi:MAG: flagellar cap protein FliD N-terminal domain-containing protein, partial [bacterium]
MGDSSLIGRPTFGGLSTGLDTSALIDGLLALERQPLNRIRARRAEVDEQRGLMRDLNSKLLALRTAAQEIDNRNSTGNDFSTTEELLRYSGSSTNE